MLKEFVIEWKLLDGANKNVVQKLYVKNIVVEELITTFLETLEKYGEFYKKYWTNSDTRQIANDLGLKERDLEKDYFYYTIKFILIIVIIIHMNIHMMMNL